MKTGKSLTELAQEIERQEEAKTDYIARTDSLLMKDRKLIMNSDDGHIVHDITGHAHNQIAARLDIPKKYYDRMFNEQPELLADNVNTWFQSKKETRMVRTMDNSVRAFLSDRYRALDNFDLMSAVLPILAEKSLDVVSCDVTDKRLYIKALIPGMTKEVTKSVRKGEIVSGGVMIQNSEIGCGTLAVQSFMELLACTNGLVMPTGVKRYHSGKRQEADEAIQELLSNKTKEAADVAFWMKVKDITRAALTRDIFDQNIAIIEDSIDDKIESSPIKVVEKTVKRFNLTEAVGEVVLNNLVNGADLSKFGLMNAVTAVANEHDDYEMATELEKTGGKILVLPKSEWQEIAA